MNALRALTILLLLCLFSGAPRSAHAQPSPVDPTGVVPIDPGLPSPLASPSTTEGLHVQDLQPVVNLAKTFWPRLALASWLAPAGHHAAALRWVSPASAQRQGF
jgi:hypothetical protein